MSKTPTLLLLGGNLGQEAEIFASALEQLANAGFQVTAASKLWRTAPVACVPGTPEFCNQAVCGLWDKSAQELLLNTQKCEIQAGRPQQHRSDESRKLDIDIILFGSEIINEVDLQVPHPRARERLFVLEPAFEIASEWKFPDNEETIREALQQLR